MQFNAAPHNQPTRHSEGNPTGIYLWFFWYQSEFHDSAENEKRLL